MEPRNWICKTSSPKLKSTVTRSSDVQIAWNPDRSNALGEIYQSMILFRIAHISSCWGRIWPKTRRIESADSPLSIGAQISHWEAQFLEKWRFRNGTSTRYANVFEPKTKPRTPIYFLMVFKRQGFYNLANPVHLILKFNFRSLWKIKSWI